MRRLSSAGTVIVVEAEGQAFEFRARRRGVGVLGCMSGRAKLGKLRDSSSPQAGAVACGQRLEIATILLRDRGGRIVLGANPTYAMTTSSPNTPRLFAARLADSRLLFAVLFSIVFSAAIGAADAAKMFDVPAGAAAETLKRFAQQAGQQVVFPANEVRGVRTAAVKGEFTARDGLTRLLAGTELAATFDEKSGTFAVARAADPNAPRATPAAAPARPRNELPEEAVVLSPFTVNAEADSGYAATSTLAGSRFKTDLRDVAASISVLTSDFLGDIGANNLEEALRYSNSAQLDVGSAGSDGSTPNGNSYQGGPAAFIVRGQPTTQARNYFTLRVQTDGYNVERIEDSRGPNSVLFGFGSPGGIINVSTKQARTDRSFQRATLQTGSYASHRETLDFNRVLLAGKLALRVNAVYDQSNKFQEYAFNRDRRYNLAVKYQVQPTLAVRAEYERSFIKENKPRPWSLFDGGLLLWQQLGSPTYSTAIATNAALSVTRLGTGRRLSYIGNNNTLIETGNTLTTFDPAPTAVRAITDSKIADRSINYGGPGQINTTVANTFTAFVEKQIGRRTFLELAFNHQDQAGERYNPGQTNLKLFGDPNQFLRTGQANPYAGKTFVETSSNVWERNQGFDSSNLIRATVSTEFDAGKWGNYRVAALGEYDRRGNVSDGQREVFAGRPFNVAPENAANQVRRRNYVTPGDWSTYFINSPLTKGLVKGVADPLTGLPLNSVWVARSQSQDDDPATQKSALAAGQARYFNNRLVLSGGIRSDKLEILDRTAQRDPVTNEWSRAYATEAKVKRDARNSTLGAVVHVTDNISVHYNRANNQGLGGSQRIIDLNNLNGPVLAAPNSEGEGQDLGVTLKLLDGKVSLRAGHFTTNAKNLSDSFSPTGVGPDKVAATVLGTLQTAGLITTAVRDARTPNSSGVLFDFESKGYEFSLTANPTKNWRLQANYSYTDSHVANYGREIRAWMTQEIAFWKSFNRGSLITSGSTTIDQAIDFMLAGFNSQANLSNVGEPGLRKHKVNFFTRYDLPSEILKGAYIGGGYQHQTKALAGTDVTNTIGFYGNSFWRADALAGYKFQKSTLQRFGRFAQGLSLQLNVTNVFNEHDLLITRIQPDGVTPLRAVLQNPRTWRLQASLDF
ncbi:MAG: TonB-dependent receptor [Opitutaceae bacterium]|nr:TonB-dependent receptor [Opitutaceae bacterium]